MKKIFTVSVLLFTANCLSAQVDTLLQNDSVNELIEEVSSENEDTQIYDLLEQLSENPVPINSADENEITKIPFLDYQTASKIVAGRKTNGIFHNADDLYKIENIDRETIDKILPFITFDEPFKPQTSEELFSWQNTKLNFRSRGIVDLQDNQGVQQNKFTGSKLKTYQRLQIKRSDQYKIGLLTEKDAGENSFTDFYSFYLELKNLGIFDKIILGDYLIEFGQGLAIWSPYGFFKSTNAVDIINRNSRGITAYTSTDENQFMRGASFQLSAGSFKIIPFYSSHSIDASIDSVTSLITSTPIDGYHRTQSELSRKKTLQTMTYGISLSYNFMPNLNTGFLYYKTKFGSLFANNSAFERSGNEFEFYSLSYSAFWKYISVSGEFSYNKISVASINSIEISLTPQFAFVSSFRNYPANYINIYSNGLGERTGTQNEIGFYTGFRLKTIAGTINFYYDQFKFPYATFYNPVPASGNEFLLYYYVHPFSNTTLTIKYKNENKEVTKPFSDENIIDNQLKQNLRFDFTYSVNKFISLKTRLESVFLSFKKTKEDEKGFLIYQDIKMNPAPQLLLYLRAAFFKTDSYNSRVYEFESDAAGIITNSPLYGEGMKWYLLAKYRFEFGLALSIKYSELYKPKERTIGSGYNEINGSLDNTLYLQVDLEL